MILLTSVAPTDLIQKYKNKQKNNALPQERMWRGVFGSLDSAAPSFNGLKGPVANLPTKKEEKKQLQFTNFFFRAVLWVFGFKSFLVRNASDPRPGVGPGGAAPGKAAGGRPAACGRL